MNRADVPTQRFELVGLDGANPLGFLAALGTLATLRHPGDSSVRLSWVERGRWLPVVEGASAASEEALCETIARGLHGRNVSPDAEKRRAAAQKATELAKSAITKKAKEIRARRLSRDERRAAEEAELGPLMEQHQRRRSNSLAALAKAVQLPELALGKRLDCTESEYRQLAADFLEGAGYAAREAVDMLAAFGTDAAIRNQTNSIEPTRFCFISGGGHQDFLDTVRQLIDRINPSRIHEALFQPWKYEDERLSMRWDPVEDKRYALLDRDPGPQGARTVWMANLLAYRGLVLFPCSPGRRGLATTGWTRLDDDLWFTWPIWTVSASFDAVRSLLQLDDLATPQPDRAVLRARGVAAVYRARRIRVPPTGTNYKLNFSPARAV